MDSATLAAMQASSGGEGNWFLGAVNVEGGGIEGLLNIGAISGEDNLAKWLPVIQQAIVFNYPGGILMRLLQKFLDLIKNDKWMDALDLIGGVSGGESMSEGSSVSPSSGGESPSSGASHGRD